MTNTDDRRSSPALSCRPAPAPDLDLLNFDWQHPTQEATFALPVITDAAGSTGVTWGPAGIQNWLEPPTGLPTPVGLLYRVDAEGRATKVAATPTSYAWTPWEIRRQHPAVTARTRLHPDAAAVTEELTFTEPGRYALVFSGLCRTWSFAHYWNLPPHDVPQLNVTAQEGQVRVGDTKTFGQAVFSVDAVDQAIEIYPDYDTFLSGTGTVTAGRVAAVVFDADAGQQVTWVGVQGSAPHPVVPAPDTTAHDWWQCYWSDVFRGEGETFSGRLPSVTFDDPDLDRLYYVSILTLLLGRRHHRPMTERDRHATGGQAIWTGSDHRPSVAWTIGATEGAATTAFVWETHLVAPLLARLDPVVFKDQLTQFLTADVTHHWGIEILTGQAVGMWYAINDTAIVAAAADYLDATHDIAWLTHRLPSGRTVSEQLLIHVERHRVLADGGPLADYGPAENLLECVSSYQHEVASINAMAAWAYRFAAARLDPGRHDELTARADQIDAAVLSLATGDGTFRCGLDGDRTATRTVLDLVYVGTYLDQVVPEPVRAAMLDFLRDELVTPTWLRALSLADADSQSGTLPDFQTFRADHQSTGSYDGWPAMAAVVQARWGQPQKALDWLRRISTVTREGPFGQAHSINDQSEGPQAHKASFINGNCYLEVCGSRFATALLQLAAVLPLPAHLTTPTRPVDPLDRRDDSEELR